MRPSIDSFAVDRFAIDSFEGHPAELTAELGVRVGAPSTRGIGVAAPAARPRLHGRTLFACGVATLEFLAVFELGLLLLYGVRLGHVVQVPLPAGLCVAFFAAAVSLVVMMMAYAHDVCRLARPALTRLDTAAAAVAGGMGCFVALCIVHAADAAQLACLWAVATLVLTLAVRAGWATALQMQFARGRLQCRIAVLGGGVQSEAVRACLADRRDLGVVVAPAASAETVLARWGSLERFCHAGRIDAVVVQDRLVAERLRCVEAAQADVFCIDASCETSMLSARHPLHGLPLTRLHRRPLSDSDLMMKLLFDRVAAGLILIAIVPFLALVALVVKLTSPGPVLFRQPRVGFNNQIFFVLKFRTMYHQHSDLFAHRQTERGDARVTPLGRVLRRLSLDELPQLLNVMQGEMSLVGPRPHAPQTSIDGRVIQDMLDGYALRHRVPPGITGWAQVNGARGALRTRHDLERRVRLDLDYIARWSLALDVKILVLTLWRELFSKTAY
jgi:exopolysaccharide biosynthesis polyprenyl glycosylphosphotransferase